MNPDIRQSSEFASFMSDIGWYIESVSGQYIYMRKFPIVGFFAKCPRPQVPIDATKILKLMDLRKIFNLKLAPNINIEEKNYSREKSKLLKQGFKIEHEPFNPVKTIIISLTPTEPEIFNSFSEAKRRGIRRAIKFGISVSTSDDIDAFIKIRQKQFSPMGFLITVEMKALWKNFYPEKCDLLLAKNAEGNPVAGILLLYHKKNAYYWYASALRDGKKQFAPTLLVWEAIKLAKKKGCTVLDFEGVYDERFPKASESWRGFTKFKEGFSDKTIIYMENFYLKRPIIRL